MERKIDGVNLLPHLTGENTGNPHSELFWAQPRAFHWDPINIPFWRDYDKYVTGESDYYPKIHTWKVYQNSLDSKRQPMDITLLCWR